MSAEKIDHFWQWWSEINLEFAKSFDEKKPLPEDLITAMSAQVAAIDPQLDWEFGKGVKSRHQLCLSSMGDPILRLICERWVKRGPGDSDVWEYYASRQASPSVNQTLTIWSRTIDLGEYRFVITEDSPRERLDIIAYHPANAEAESNEQSLRILMIALDLFLGEDNVERWIGSIDLAESSPAEAVEPSALRERVNHYAKQTRKGPWVILRGEKEESAFVAIANLALKRIDHLLLDMHMTVTFVLKKPTENGLVTNHEADDLNLLEDSLCKALANHALLLGRATHHGKRTIHFRITESGPASQIVDRWVQTRSDYETSVDTMMDPRWEQVPWR